MSGRVLIHIQIVLAAAVFGGAVFFGAFRHIEPFFTYLYFFCWIPFVWVLDRLLLLRTGESWIRKPKLFGWLLFFSTTLWLIFEVLNFRLNNWFYVGLPEPAWIRWPGYALSYATVVPGILMLAKLLRTDEEIANTARVGKLWNLPLGLAMLFLSMMWPLYFFPLVWGGVFFLLEPVVQKLGGHSLLQDWKQKQWRTTQGLLLAGLLCGLFWESCNYGARAKWVYTIPFVGVLKIFEMPVLGFLGFPAFALEVFVMHQAGRLLWKKCPASVKAGLFVLMIFFWWAAFEGIDRFTVIRDLVR